MNKFQRILQHYRQIKNSTSGPYTKPYEFRNMTDYEWYKKCCSDISQNYGTLLNQDQSYLSYWFHRKKADVKLLLSIAKFYLLPGFQR